MRTAPLLRLTLVMSATACLSLAGCKKGVNDTTLANNVHQALSSDAAIANEPIQTSVQSGVVTLQGNVSNDTARLVAASDAARVAGVKEVVNNLSVAGTQLTPTVTSPEAPTVARTATPAEQEVIATKKTLPPPTRSVSTAASTPAPPPAPVYHDITVAAGRDIPVRITQSLSSAHSQEGDPFSGVVTAPINVDGELAIPAGSAVSGRVTDVHEAGHYKGNSLLSVSITSISRHGDRIPVATDSYTLEGKGRGKNTAEKIGGGAAVGAILGGIFGGGKGAAIGAAAGGGGGAVLNGVTRGQQVEIPSESVVRFRLIRSITVRSEGAAAGETRERELERR